MNFDILAILIVFLIVLCSMVLHEMAHAYIAYFLGDTTAKDEGRLSLNPLIHIDLMMSIIVPLILFISGGPVIGGAKPVPIVQKNLKGKEWGMALVAFVGPFTNFLIALIGFLVGHLSGYMYTGGYVKFFFEQLILANLGFMVFNLIPIPPLDGSRILYAISPDAIREILVKIETKLGLILIIILFYGFGSYFAIFTTQVMKTILKFFYLLVDM